MFRFGFVTFVDEEHARAAVQQPNAIDGKTVDAKSAQAEPGDRRQERAPEGGAYDPMARGEQGIRTNKVFVGGISHATSVGTCADLCKEKARLMSTQIQ